MKVWEDFHKFALSERYGGAAKERSIWFHGTRYKNLTSIMSKGLVPDPKERAWAEDPDAAMHTPSRASYGGIYVAQNLMTAISSAKGGRGEPKVIVCMELQPRTFIADEDDLTLRVNYSGMPDQMAIHDYSLADIFISLVVDPKDQVKGFGAETAKKNIEKYIREFKDSLLARVGGGKSLNPKLVQAADKPMEIAWRASILRKVAYIRWDSIISAAEHGIEGFRENYDKWVKKLEKLRPTKAEGEKAFREAVDKLTRLFKDYARPVNKDTTRGTARVLTPIGFRGKNKIVCIVVLERDPDNEYGEVLDVRYGKPPEDFLKQYSQRVGTVKYKA